MPEPIVKDASDWIAAQPDKTPDQLAAELVRLAEAKEPWTPQPPDKPKKADVGDAAGDIRLGLEFVAHYRDRVRYCPDLESWYVWDGKRWGPDAVHEAELLARTLIQDRLTAATKIADNDRRDSETKFWLRAMKKGAIEAALWIARSEPAIIARLDALDSNPWLLNALNGTIDLRTGERREFDPTDLITRLAPVEYDPQADQAEWLKFLLHVIPAPDVRNFLQRAAGYSLTGRPVEECLFFIHGPPNGGKGTFVAAMTGALGDYSASANFESFLKRDTGNRGGPRSDIVRLSGRRFVSSQETEDGDKLAGGLLKWLTGQDVICERDMYASEVEFLPTFTLWLVSNFRPQARDDDPALWRRLMLVPFTTSIPPEERDPAVKERLRNPGIGGPAVLAWAIAGCLAWREDGLKAPTAVILATKQWRAENNPIADWLTDKTLMDPEASTLFVELNASYKSWVQENNIKRPVSGITLAKALKNAGCSIGTERERTYHGLKLKSPFSTSRPFPQPEPEPQLTLDDIPPMEQSGCPTDPF